MNCKKCGNEVPFHHMSIELCVPCANPPKSPRICQALGCNERLSMVDEVAHPLCEKKLIP